MHLQFESRRKEFHATPQGARLGQELLTLQDSWVHLSSARR